MKLFKHQQELIDQTPCRHLLAWGTGSGKTLTAIELCKKFGGLSLVICPKALVDNWGNEVVKWEGDDFCVESKERFKKNLEKYTAHNWDNLVVDEAHYFSNYKSQMTKSLLQFIKKVQPKRIYLLTATPYLSSSFNIYTLATILGYKWNWMKFRKHFFFPEWIGSQQIWVQRKGIEQEVATMVNTIGSTVKLEDCFDVPEQIYLYESFELTKEQERAIDGIVDILPIVRFTKEHQICGGTLKGDGYTPTAHFKSEKIIRLLEIIGENEKVAVVCRYNEEINFIYEQISEAYPGRNICRITGQIDGDERHHVVENINKADNIIVLLNAACSEGYGIPYIPLMIFYSYDFSLKNFVQMQGRIQRADNIKKNVYLSLVVKNSIDEKIYQSVAIAKRDFHAELFKK